MQCFDFCFFPSDFSASSGYCLNLKIKTVDNASAFAWPPCCSVLVSAGSWRIPFLSLDSVVFSLPSGLHALSGDPFYLPVQHVAIWAQSLPSIVDINDVAGVGNLLGDFCDSFSVPPSSTPHC